MNNRFFQIISFVIIIYSFAFFVFADCDYDRTPGDEGVEYISEPLTGNIEDTDRSTPNTVEKSGCCGDFVNEWLIKMNDFAIVEILDNGTRERQIFSNNYACCDERTDCVYKGKCYDIGQEISANPRYACGANNELVEALDYDYEDSENIMDTPTVKKGSNAYTVQEVLSVNPNLISCNSYIPYLPQRWLPINQCKQGLLKIKILDGPSGNLIKNEPNIQLELFKLAGLATKKYTNYTINKSDEGVYTLRGLLASYYNILVTTGGSLGTLSTVRVDYDNSDPEVHEIETYRDNTCIGCVDQSLGGGLCNMNCEGRGFGANICEYDTDEIAQRCHLHAPGNEVVLFNGSRVECCNKVKGLKLPEMRVSVTSDKEHLIRKEYAVQWRGKPIKMIVVTTGDE